LYSRSLVAREVGKMRVGIAGSIDDHEIEHVCGRHLPQLDGQFGLRDRAVIDRPFCRGLLDVMNFR
jgi:hypothetical protein